VISQQLQQYDGHLVFPPKTTHSAPVTALDHTTVAALRATANARSPSRPYTDRATGPAVTCSPISTVTRWHLTGSPAPSRKCPLTRDCHRSGCTTCAAGAFQHRAHRRHLHLGPAEGRLAGRQEGGLADHPSWLPGARHALAATASDPARPATETQQAPAGRPVTRTPDARSDAQETNRTQNTEHRTQTAWLPRPARPG
jgi:hypothetical protein